MFSSSFSSEPLTFSFFSEKFVSELIYEIENSKDTVKYYDKNKIIPHESLISFKEKFGAKAMIRKVLIRKI